MDITDTEDLITFGSEIKALGDGRVGGYLVRFSTKEDPDLTDDFFTKDSAITVPDALPVLYNHGQDKTIKKRVIGKATTRVDEVGLWAETQLAMRDQYEKAIYEMAEAGKLGYSSGALSHLVEREPVGKGIMFIKTWFIGEASLTPTPAEPRNSIITLKSLLTSDQAALLIHAEDTKLTNLSTGENEMTEQMDIKSAVDAAVAAALKLKADEEAIKAERIAEIESAKREAAKEAVDALHAKNMIRTAPYIQTDKRGDDNDGVQAFKSWLGTGQVNGSLISPDSQLKAVFNVADGATGGYLVPDPLYNQIIAKRDIASWCRIAPCQTFQTPADHILIPVSDTKHTAFVLTAEKAAYNEDEGTLAQVDLVLKKYTKEVDVSEEFLNYQGTNFDSWLAYEFGRAEAVTENTLATTAILASATAAAAAASATALTAAEVARLIGTLGAGYNVQGQCGILSKNATKWYLKGLTPGYFAFNSTPTAPDIFGYPNFVSDDMPAMTAGLRSTLFGNFNFFAIAERPGMLIQRNPYLRMANGEVAIFANIFRAFGVLQAEAFYTMAQV